MYEWKIQKIRIFGNKWRKNKDDEGKKKKFTIRFPCVCHHFLSQIIRLPLSNQFQYLAEWILLFYMHGLSTYFQWTLWMKMSTLRVISSQYTIFPIWVCMLNSIGYVAWIMYSYVWCDKNSPWLFSVLFIYSICVPMLV